MEKKHTIDKKSFINDMNNLAIFHLKSGHFKQAKEACFKAMKIEKNNKASLSILSLVYASNGEFEAAKHILFKSIGIYGKNIQSCSNLGKIFFQTGDTKNSQHWLSEALKIKPNDEELKKLLALCIKIEKENKISDVYNHFLIPGFSFSFIESKCHFEYTEKDFYINEKIDIIIPIFNGYDFLEPLFQSVINNTLIEYNVFILNDNSTDERVLPFLTKLAHENKHFSLVNNESNLGFTSTVNKGYQLTKHHFVILNQDTVVPPYWLERLMYPIISNDQVASVTPFSNAATICSFPLMPEDNALMEGMSVNEIDAYFFSISPKDTYVQIPTGVGFCMGINKHVAKKIGFLNVKEFPRGYGEENDWCMRAYNAGYRNVHATNLFVYHKHGGSFESEEKKRLINNAIEKVGKLHPIYHDLVQEFIKNDPVKYFRQFLHYEMLHQSQALKPCLIIDHIWGGGANKFSNEIKNKLSEKKHIVFFLIHNRAEQKTKLLLNHKNLDYDWEVKNPEEISNIISLFKIESVYMNELVTHPEPLEIIHALLEQKQKTDFHLTIYIHDYFSICPSYTLMNYKDDFCDVPQDILFCENCLIQHPADNFKFLFSEPKQLKMNEWRKVWLKFLNRADDIICFSESSQRFIKQTYPTLYTGSIRLIPHKVNSFKKRPTLPEKETSDFIVIGVLGNINKVKGIYIIKKMLDTIRANALNIKIVLMGDTSEPLLEDIHYINTGSYTHEELPNLMEKYAIDIVFLPSIWPETFSYVTEEVMLLDIPIAVFDLGAPPERVKKYKKGLIIKEINSNLALGKIQHFIKTLRTK